MNPGEIEALEHRSYRAVADDGLWDIVLGLCIASLGARIIWGIPWLTGVLGGLAYASWRGLRAWLVEPRLGYVRLHPDRRKSVILAVCIAAGLLLVFIFGSIAVESAIGYELPTSKARLLLSGVIGLPIAIAGYLLEIRRLYAYGALVSLSSSLAYLTRLPYEWVILACGGTMMIAGMIVLRIFLRKHPPAI